MPYATPLSEDEVRDGLRDLPGWEVRDGRLRKTFRRRDFRGSLALVLAVADVADAQDHHPDIAIRWDRVEFALWTWAARGITGRDLRLAHAIEELEAQAMPA